MVDTDHWPIGTVALIGALAVLVFAMAAWFRAKTRSIERRLDEERRDIERLKDREDSQDRQDQ